MIRLFKRIREIINTFLYDSQDWVLSLFRTAAFLCALAALVILVYYYGFPVSPDEKFMLLEVIKGIFGVFIANFLVRLFYSFEKSEFIKGNWFEGILILMLLYDIVSYFWFDYPILGAFLRYMGATNYTSVYTVFIQLYMLLLIMIESVRISRYILSIRIRPATLFLFSFFMLVIAGTFFLLLPEMRVDDSHMKFVDALFMATSAVCVTGLSVVDVGTYFTLKGQVVLMVLMQVGGIGIVSFATFFASFLKKGVGIRHQAAMQELLSEDSLFDSLRLLKEIIFYTLIFEAAGSVLIFFMWDPAILFSGAWQKAYYSVFHAVSAFNNAGITLFTGGLMNPALQDAYILHLVFAVLIVLGGLGFPAHKDLFGIRNLRMRMRLPWKRWKTSTQIAVHASILLIVSGTVLFYLLEREYALAGLSNAEAVITAIFQSVTARTAGFNTVDIGSLTTPALIMMLFLMFVGASSGGTGGGIKTSTFTVILLSVWTTVRGKRQITIGRKSVSHELLFRAFSIFIFSSLFVLLATFCLSIAEPGMEVMALLFEEISAFATVGLSTGITEHLSLPGKSIIILSMFIGRVGVLTLAFSLSSPSRDDHYQYPQTNILVG